VLAEYLKKIAKFEVLAAVLVRMQASCEVEWFPTFRRIVRVQADYYSPSPRPTPLTERHSADSDEGFAFTGCEHCHRADIAVHVTNCGWLREDSNAWD
jgi:hypothetical protein